MSTKSRKFLLGFGLEGFEFLVDLDELEQLENQRMLEKLASPDGVATTASADHHLQRIRLRMRINSQRCIQAMVIQWPGNRNSLIEFYERNRKKFEKNPNKFGRIVNL
jgi:hypothetical protein